MAHYLRFRLNGADVFDFGLGFSGANNYALAEYNPALPATDKETGEYDLTSDLWDTLLVDIRGTSADNLIENLNALERYFLDCQRWEQDHNYLSGKGELEFGIQNATNRGTTKVTGGWIETPREILGPIILSNMIFRAVIHFKRRPYFLGPFALVTNVTNSTNNDLLNYAVLPSLAGELSQARAVLTISGGNAASAQRALIALRSSRTPANFQHILQAEAATLFGTGVIALTDANLSPGSGVSGARYTPTTTNKIMLMRWEVTANLDDQKGTFLVLVVYRDNAATVNFKLHFRNGLKHSASNFTWQPFSTVSPIRTMFVGGTTELGILELGQIVTPSGGSPTLPSAGATFAYELWGEALAVTGSLDIDEVKLFPIGEAGAGRGMQAAEFGQAIGANYVFFDSRDDYDPAYMTNPAGYMVALPLDLPEGAPFAIPSLRANFRLYALVTQGISGFYKYNRVTGLSVQIETQPLYIRMRGTS